MDKVFIIAWREFKQTVLRKVFLLALLGIPLLIIGVSAIAILMVATQKEPPLVGRIVVVDPDGAVAAAAGAQFSQEAIQADQNEQIQQTMDALTEGGPMPMPGAGMPAQRGEIRVTIEARPGLDEDAIDALRAEVRNGDPIALVIVPEAVLDAPDPDAETEARFELFIEPDMDVDHAGLVERRMANTIVRVRATRAGLAYDDLRTLMERPDVTTTRLLASGEAAPEGDDTRAFRMMVPFVFMMLLWTAVFTAGQHLLSSTIEEKSNRVMEVLLSAVSPVQLMTGKIIGHGGVGLLLVVVYSPVLLAGMIAFAVIQGIPWMLLLYMLIYFLMAYFMIASLMAAIGGAVSDLREANTLLTPVMMLLMVLLMLWMPISTNPNGGIATAFSFIPPAIPFAMIARVTADEPVAAWQIILSIVWGTVATVGMVWMAARIFRVGVLMYGKPPSPLELLRWVRYA